MMTGAKHSNIAALAAGLIWVFSSGWLPAQALQDAAGPERYGFLEAPRAPGSTVAHSATRLAHGDVLVVGGYGLFFGKVPIAATLARVYEQRKHTWRVLEGALNFGRLGHAAIRVGEDKVLIVGGRGQENKPLRSVELFDGRTEQFTVVGFMAQGRLRPCLNLLDSGKVLITGETEQAEIIEPDEEAKTGFRIRPTLTRSRYKHSDHAAVTLKDGAVLLVGGRCVYLERFNPKTERYTVRRAKLPKMLDDQAAALLYDGRVLLAGGQEILTNISVDQCWIYDPAADQLSPGPPLRTTTGEPARGGVSDLGAVDLFAGNEKLAGRYILLCGGEYDSGPADQADMVLRSAWVYDAAKGELMDVGPMRHGHDDFAAVALENSDALGGALIIGGYGPGDIFQSDCEIFYWWL